MQTNSPTQQSAECKNCSLHIHVISSFSKRISLLPTTRSCTKWVNFCEKNINKSSREHSEALFPTFEKTNACTSTYVNTYIHTVNLGQQAAEFSIFKSVYFFSAYLVRIRSCDFLTGAVPVLHMRHMRVAFDRLPRTDIASSNFQPSAMYTITYVGILLFSQSCAVVCVFS